MDVLVYIDDLPTSDDTLALAALWLERIPAYVTVISPAKYAAALREKALNRLPAALREMVTFKTTESHPLTDLCDECERGAYDLLIVAPAGRGPVERLLRGSRIGQVVHSITTSVLVARRVPPAIHRVLVGVGTAEHALVDVRVAIHLAKIFGAELNVVHIVSQVPLMFTGIEHMRLEVDAYVNSGLPGVNILAVARQTIADAGLEPRIHLREGLVRDELVEEACGMGYDLLVIGAHEGKGWMSFLLDDIADHIVRECPIPTLVVRTEPRWI